MGTEVITLGLEKVGWQILGSVTIEPTESGGESGSWDTEESSSANNLSPSWLCLVDGLVEEVIEEKVLKVWVVTESRCNVLKEDRADDASSTPH